METKKLREFSGFRMLALLSLCGNEIRGITPGTFEKMNRLAYLVLVDNIIEHLGVDIIWGPLI